VKDMDREIKKIIEKLEKGEVPDGYKNTKIGILPENWGLKRLSEHAKYITKGTTPTSLKYSYQKEGINFIKTENINEYGKIDYKSTSKISASCDLALKRSRLEDNDILFSIAGSLGTVATVSKECLPANTNQAIAIIRLKDLNEVFYYSKILKSRYLKRYIYLNTSKGIQANLSLNQIRNILIPIPEKKELEKISEILFIWEKAIELKEKLISEKKILKKGLMQNLLTGNLRFPEYQKEWKEYRLNNLLKVVKREENFKNNRLYNLVSVRRRSGGLFYRGELWGYQIKTKNLSPILEGDFLISKMQIVHGALGLVEHEYENYHVSDSYIILRSKNNEILNIKFFNYLTQLPFMYHKAYVSSYGVHIEKMTFNLKLYLNEKIRIPQDIGEQENIINILNLISKDINIMEKELDELKVQEKRLTELLIFGTIR
jgi:type I restriction enzyme S subunit